MNEQGEDATEHPAGSVGADPRDGTIEFARYSTEQLEELQFGIDRRAFPQNFANLSAELQRRAASGTAQSDAASNGRFSSRDGLTGWIEARGRHNPLYGAGSVAVAAEHVNLQGWRRTWLGAPERAEIAIPLASIRNVVRDGDHIRFEYKVRFSRHVEFTAESPERARVLQLALPAGQTERFPQQWIELREFNRRLDELGQGTWITPALVAANVLVYLIMALIGGKLGGFDPQEYATWGANIGPMTLGGQWWRLLTAVFVHLNLAHVLLNMWALWNIARLAERLFGRWLLLLVYCASGALASLSSVIWNPTVASVGASGAIFGLFGAFFAFLAKPDTLVPRSVIRTHWLSTAVFVTYSLFNGFLSEGIDNAAHVGGLLAGFALGWVAARPLDATDREEFPFPQLVACLGITGAALLAGLWQMHALGPRRTTPEQYAQQHAAYAKAAAENLRLWQEVVGRATAYNLTSKQLADRFDKDIRPFWSENSARLHKELPTLPRQQQWFAQLVADEALARLEWARMIIEAARTQQQSLYADLPKFEQRAVLASARITRAELVDNAVNGPRGLSSSAWVTRVRSLLKGSGACVRAPVAIERPVSPTDSTGDGPAVADTLGCRAQQLFLSGRYQKLDRMLSAPHAAQGDLADGTSSLGALEGGLSDLFQYGALDLRSALEHTADWRRAEPDSAEPDLAEALVFEAWAWSARGFGPASSVSQEAWALFYLRINLGAASLHEIEARAVSNPLWYQLSINIEGQRATDRARLRALFDSGVRWAPRYLPLYRTMMRMLMPRWSGSYALVDKFVDDVTNKPEGRDEALYAQLYWSYDSLERDDIKLFDDSGAIWPIMKAGFVKLREQHPHSDHILNAVARFACIADDGDAYQALRPLLENHISTTVWSEKISLESCDRQLAPQVLPLGKSPPDTAHTPTPPKFRGP
jgi:rhomboid protease GluP